MCLASIFLRYCDRDGRRADAGYPVDQSKRVGSIGSAGFAILWCFREKLVAAVERR